MSAEQIRQLIETGNLAQLESALAANASLSNECIEWGPGGKNRCDPLHYLCDCVFNDAIDESKAAEIAALLLRHGAVVDGSPGLGSPLIAATSLGAESVAELLIDAGANLEVAELFGARPLHWAAAMGLPATVKRLLAGGAELEVKCTEFGATPLYWAVVGFGPNGPNKKQQPLASAKVLIDAGAVVDTSNIEGVTALECSKGAESSAMHDLLRQSVAG